MRHIWTVGHSNLQLGEFLAILHSWQIEIVADVRRFPGSKRQPQFGSEVLEKGLGEAGFDYRHFPNLGGRRKERVANSPNGGWRVESFNAYADYMLSGAFGEALEELAKVAAEKRTVIMCAEAVPWRCHRRLIADALVVQGWVVWDILSKTRADEHKLTPFAQVVEGRLIYPPPAALDKP